MTSKWDTNALIRIINPVFKSSTMIKGLMS